MCLLAWYASVADSAETEGKETGYVVSKSAQTETTALQ